MLRSLRQRKSGDEATAKAPDTRLVSPATRQELTVPIAMS